MSGHCCIDSTQRQNIFAIVSSVIANMILGIVIGSVFYNLDETVNSLQERTLLLFFALMLNAFVPGVEVCIFRCLHVAN